MEVDWTWISLRHILMVCSGEDYYVYVYLVVGSVFFGGFVLFDCGFGGGAPFLYGFKKNACNSPAPAIMMVQYLIAKYLMTFK